MMETRYQKFFNPNRIGYYSLFQQRKTYTSHESKNKCLRYILMQLTNTWDEYIDSTCSITWLEVFFFQKFLLLQPNILQRILN